MKKNPIIQAIRDSYLEHGWNTEKAVHAMLMTRAVKQRLDLDTFDIREIAKTIIELRDTNTCINFSDGEMVFNNIHEVHSVSASRDEDGVPEVFIHMLNLDTMETDSTKIRHFANVEWLLQIVESVHEKCGLTIEIDEDDED